MDREEEYQELSMMLHPESSPEKGSPNPGLESDDHSGREENGRGDRQGFTSTCSTPSWSMGSLPGLSSSNPNALRSCISACSTIVGTPTSSPPTSSVSSLSPFYSAAPNVPTCGHAHHIVKSVTFSTTPPEVYDTWLDDEYDRSPHPVVIRLSYRDVLELREMKVGLGIVTKRQQAMSGGGGDEVDGVGKVKRKAMEGEETTRDEQSRGRRQVGAGSGLRLDLSTIADDRSAVASTFQASTTAHVGAIRTYKPPSPSVFPSSPFLVSQLQCHPRPQPPARAVGVGIAVQPTFDIAGSATGSSSSPQARGRLGTTSRSSSYGSVAGGSRGRLARKTSSDSIDASPSTSSFGGGGGGAEEEESEFQRELRQAREELEMLAVKEMRDKEMLGRGRTRNAVPLPTASLSLVDPGRPPRAASTHATPLGAAETSSRAGSRSAAFFETSVMPLRPPSAASSSPLRKLCPPIAGRSQSVPFLRDDSSCGVSGDDSESASPPIDGRPASTATSDRSSPKPTNVPFANREPLFFTPSLSVPHIHTHRSPHTASASIHSPLPERDPSPMITPSSLADEEDIHTPTTTDAEEVEVFDSLATTPKPEQHAEHVDPPIQHKRGPSPAPCAITPRAARTANTASTPRSSFFDAHSPISAPFARSTPEVEVSR